MSTRNWNEGAPASGDNVGEGDDRIREEKFDTRERLQQGGHVVESGGPYTPAAGVADTDGRHAVNGTNHPIGFKVYKSDKTTLQTDFTDTTVALGSGVSITGGNVTTGTDPGHVHSGTIAIWVPGLVAPGRVRVTFRAPKALTFIQAHIHAITRPVGGGNLRLNIGKLSTPGDGTDRMVAGATALQAAGDRPFLVPGGDYHSDGNAVFSTSTMIADDELVFDIENTGAAWSSGPQDVLIHLDVTG